MQHTVWQPSVKWHAVCFGICLAVCLAVFCTLSYLTARLPAPYQPHVTAAGTTPWRD